MFKLVENTQLTFWTLLESRKNRPQQQSIIRKEKNEFRRKGSHLAFISSFTLSRIFFLAPFQDIFFILSGSIGHQDLVTKCPGFYLEFMNFICNYRIHRNISLNFALQFCQEQIKHTSFYVVTWHFSKRPEDPKYAALPLSYTL